jgi:2-dehydropantoate 2-reductase
VEADRPEPGVIVHTSPFLRVDLAPDPRSERLAHVLREAEIPAKVGASEAAVLWGKLVRLNALACTTTAHDALLGEIRTRADWRADLLAAIDEGAAVAAAEGAPVAPGKVVDELWAAHATLGSSMQRDVAAGRAPELDAIPGAVLRAAARHGVACPAIEALVAQIRARLA